MLGYMVGCWVTLWDVGLHGGYCLVAPWILLDYMVESAGFDEANRMLFTW